MQSNINSVELIGGPYDGRIIPLHENMRVIRYKRKLKHGPYIIGMVLKDKVSYVYRVTSDCRAEYQGFKLLGSKPSGNLLKKHHRRR